VSSDTRTVLISPDKFKGTARARQVAEALASGIAATAPDTVLELLPVADGGDGTVEALLAAGFGALTVPTFGALGEPAETTVAVREGLAVLELASSAGLATLSGPEPVRSGSLGLGRALREVLDRGYRDVVVGLGGSASTDGGLGMLLALGAEVTDDTGRPVSPDGAGLLAAARLDLSGAALPPGTRLRLACDVDAPLHGRRGAAVVFGPQKGAAPMQVAGLDRALARWGRMLAGASGVQVAAVPGAGAAGGIAAAGLALGGAVVSGAALLLDATGFDDRLAHARLVVTGEGSWDGQSAGGKAPAQVVERARAAGVPVILVAGRVDAPIPDAVVRAWSLTALAGSEGHARAKVIDLLHSVGAEIGQALASLAPRESEPASAGSEAEPRTPAPAVEGEV
jgi:glycerate kinase